MPGRNMQGNSIPKMRGVDHLSAEVVMKKASAVRYIFGGYKMEIE